MIIGNPPSTYQIVAGEENAKEQLIKQFPKEGRAINKYFKMVKKISTDFNNAFLLKALPLPLSRFLLWTGLYRLVARHFTRAAKTPVQNVLSKLTTNKDLQAVLANKYVDYGTEPSYAPFLIHTIMESHYMNGAYYPRGGPSVIPKRVIQTILNKGGKVLVSAHVDHILLDEQTGRAKGVQMKDGVIIESNAVVSDAGFMNTVANLLPEGIINVDFATKDSKNLLRPGISGLAIFIGLKGNAKSLNLPKSNVSIHPSNDLSDLAKRVKGLTLDEVLNLDLKDISSVFVSCPSTKDSSWATRYPDKSTLEIFTLAPYHWFEQFEHTFDKTTKSHGPEYEYAKIRIAEKIWTRVVEALHSAKLPKTLEEVDYYEVGSPLSFSHYYNSQRGALYGLDHDLKRYEPKTFFLRLRPEVPEVPQLYLTGQDISINGFMGAMIGGWMCAQKVLGVTNPMSLLHNNKKKQGPSTRTK